MSNKTEYSLPVDDEKVLDKTIDVYLWVSNDLNTAEVIKLGENLISVANKKATDVELAYQRNRYPEGEVPDSSIFDDLRY